MFRAIQTTFQNKNSLKKSKVYMTKPFHILAEEVFKMQTIESILNNNHEESPSFKVQYNYISCLNEHSKELKIENNLHLKRKIRYDSELEKKVNFVRQIKNGLDREYNICLEKNDFSKTANMWIPMKSYYLMFNLWLVQYSIMKDIGVNVSHSKLIKYLKKSISDGEISFNKKEFNTCYSHKETLDFRLRKGEVLKKEYDNEKIFKSLLKKITKYKLDDYKRKYKIKNFRSKKSKEQRDKFDNDKVNIIEFFYYYRIKANYRDLNFLDHNIDDKNSFEFYRNYYELTINFYTAFKNLINNLAKKSGKYPLIEE